MEKGGSAHPDPKNQSNMKKIWIATWMILFAFGAVSAQDKIITGKVTSMEDGSGMPGVNVLVKETAIGTVTAVDGSYSIKVPAGKDVLVFSFIGYAAQEI